MKTGFQMYEDECETGGKTILVLLIRWFGERDNTGNKNEQIVDSRSRRLWSDGEGDSPGAGV